MSTIIDGNGIVTAEGTSTTQGRLRLGEDTDNGSNYVELQAPASVASNVTFTLPSADGTSGQVLQTNGSGVLSFTGSPSLTSPLAVAGNSTAGAEIRLPEDTDNGSNYVALKAANSIASNVTFTLPDADGTSGQVLQTNGSGTLSFATPSTGAVVFLQALTASNSATLDFETTIDSTYDTYMFVVSGLRPASDGVTLRARFKISGTYSESGYLSYVQYATSGGWGASSGTAALELLTPIGNASDRSCSCVAYLATPASTSLRKVWYGTGTQITNGSGDTQVNLFAGSNSSTTAVTGVRFYMSSGNITSGSVRMYGIKNS